MDEGDEPGGADDGEGGWDVDNDLDIPDLPKESSGEEAIVPNRGQAPSSYWSNNSRLVADQVAAGEFTVAARLLHEQLGITNIEPFRNVFLSLYAR